MKIVGTIEARMGSSRLPGKTLMNVYDNMTLLECIVKRFRLSNLVDEIIVATTTEKKDDAIVELCVNKKINYFRGSEDNVLDRVACAAEGSNADVIVQMGADSAYLDFELIDHLVSIYLEGNYDYVCDDMELTYPLGIYGHIISANKLIELNKMNGLSARDREDVARYIWEHPDEYRILSLKATKEFNYPALRLTVDYPEDFQLAQAVYAHFKGHYFTTKDIIGLYEQKPDIFARTKGLIQKSAPFLKE